MDTSQASCSDFTNWQPIEPDLSKKLIIELVAKNKTEMCLKLLKQKKKSLIINYIKDNFSIPRSSKKKGSKIDSEIETSIGSPIAKHHESNHLSNFFEEKTNPEEPNLKKSCSDESCDVFTKDIKTNSLRDIKVSENETSKLSKVKSRAKKLVYNYSYKYSGSQYPNKVILEKLAIVTKAFTEHFNEEQHKKFMEISYELLEHTEINKHKLRMIHSDNIVVAICLIACKKIKIEKKLFVSVINEN